MSDDKKDWPEQNPTQLSPGPWFAVREGFDPNRFLIIGPHFKNNGTSECDIAENLTEADAKAIVAWRNALLIESKIEVGKHFLEHGTIESE